MYLFWIKHGFPCTYICQVPREVLNKQPKRAAIAHPRLSWGNKFSRVNNSKVNNPNRPKFQLIRTFMPVLLTCKFDKYLIKGE